MKKKSVLITGISGYIGSNLARFFLNQGWQVSGIIRTTSNLHLLNDVKDKITLTIYDGKVEPLTKFMHDFQPSLVIHLATLFIVEHQPRDISNLINSNILFPTHLLEAMTKNNVTKLINTSTSWQHYNNEIYNPAYLYAATKEAFEKIAAFYIEAHNLNCITLELFDTYGPSDPRKKLINLFKQYAKSQKTLQMSPGEQEIDLVYINDIIDAYNTAYQLLNSNKIKNEKFSIASGNPKKLKDIALTYEKIFNTKLNIVWGGKPYRTREIMKCWNKGKTLPNWSPKYSLKQGLQQIQGKT